jgi:transcriptional regulator with XRE-family HTH domain
MSSTPVFSPEILGKNVFDQRAKKKKWSPDELAARSGVHRTHIGRIERAKRVPRIDVLLKIAWALEVDLEDLLRPPPPPRVLEPLERDAVLNRQWKLGSGPLVSGSTAKEA